MKRVLIRFYTKTPVGKLEFYRTQSRTWTMQGTKGGFDPITITTSRHDLTSHQVLSEFGWPTPAVFPSYGQTYEDVEEVKKIEPVHKSGIVPEEATCALGINNQILWFRSLEDLLAYQIQEKSNGKN